MGGDGKVSVSALLPLELEEAIDVFPVANDAGERNDTEDAHEDVTLEVEDEEFSQVERGRVHDSEVLGDDGRSVTKNVFHNL